MGIFQQMRDKNKVATVSRVRGNDDKPGVYWQRIDRVEDAETQDGQGYLKVHKTTVRVVNTVEGLETNEVGADTTQAIFDNQWGMGQRDMRKIAMAVLGLPSEEADELTFEDLERILTEEIVGEVAVVTIRPGGVTKKGKPFVKHTWERRVSPEELTNKLDPQTVDQFFPKGIAA